MQARSVSVVVVSHGRPESLLWCLSALAGLRYEPFEIVVVADFTAAAYLSESTFGSKVKLVPFETANISAARNTGIAHAAGEIIAFIDDDAAAEPTWLEHLIAPFEDETVGVCGGYVRGRNGISFQWKAREIDRSGRAFLLEHAGDACFTPKPSEGRAIKTEGTNMAVRRDALIAVGGFDEAYHFFLDETDLNLRLADAGWRTALVPLAQVHHGFKASTRRSEDRAVKDLFDVGASSAVMLRKFGAPQEERLNEIRLEQRERIEAQSSRGLLTRSEAEAVLGSLESGFNEGAMRPLGHYFSNPANPPGFLPFTPLRSGSLVLSGRIWQRRRLRTQAAEAAKDGVNVSLFLFSLSPRRHRVSFAKAGYWEQSGGQFGKADRQDPTFQLFSLKARLLRETSRIAKERGLPLTHK